MKKIVSYFFVFAMIGLAIGDHFLLQSIKPGNTVVVQTQPLAEKQIINLPEDGTSYFTTLFLPANWKADKNCRSLVAGFTSDRRLASLKAQTIFNQYDASDPMFAGRYGASVKELPCVTLTDPSGGVLYKQSGNKIPKSYKLLAQDIQSQIVTTRYRGKNYPNGKCPWEDEEKDEAVPDTTPNTSPAVDPPADTDHALPMWLALIIGTVGILVGVGPDIASKYKSLG
jgi:hypothetical protein